MYRDHLTCDTCTQTTGTTRYCALTRCYCGHTDCPAYESFIDLAALPLTEAPTPTRSKKKTSWDDREAATWLDKL
jgi:hypothetical protein